MTAPCPRTSCVWAAWRCATACSCTGRRTGPPRCATTPGRSRWRPGASPTSAARRRGRARRARRAQARRGDGRDPARQAGAAGGAPADAGRAARSARWARRRSAAGDPQRVRGRRSAIGPRGARWARRRAWSPALLAAARAASSPPTTASSTSRSPPTRRTARRRTPTRSTTAAARTWWRRCSPPPRSATSPRAARACAAPPPRRPSGSAARLWRSRCSPGASATPTRALARLLRRPGHEIQRVVGTREPTAEQLEVGQAALAEILRVEACPPARLARPARPYHSPMATEAAPPNAARSRRLPAARRPDPRGLLLGRLLQLHQGSCSWRPRPPPARDDAGVPEAGLGPRRDRRGDRGAASSWPAGDWDGLGRLEVHALHEGDEIAPGETVMTIEGDYALFAHLETVYLGCARPPHADHAQRARGGRGRGGKPILFFPARHDHWLVQTGDGWAAHVAGAIGVSTDAQASWWGGAAIGTVPHGLIAAFGGDTVAAAQRVRRPLRRRDERDRAGGLRERLRAHGARGGRRARRPASGACAWTPPSGWSTARSGTRWATSTRPG